MATIPNLATESTLTFTQALERAEVLARTALPVEAHGRVEMGMALARQGNVLQLDNGEWEVSSQTPPGTVYHVNGSCSCSDAHFRGGMCKHRLSVYLTRKAMQLMASPVETLAAQEPPAPEPPAEVVQSLDPHYVTFLHGKPFVRYMGLLALALALGACVNQQQSMAEARAAEDQQRAAARAEATQQREAIRATALPPDYREQIDADFVRTLKDPESRKIAYQGTPYGSLVCGTVNARNSYGGYTGQQGSVRMISRN